MPGTRSVRALTVAEYAESAYLAEVLIHWQYAADFRSVGARTYANLANHRAFIAWLAARAERTDPVPKGLA